MPRLVGLLVLAANVSNAHEALPATEGACVERRIAASEVRTQSDVRAFVECAEAYLAVHGTEEARRAFNEDEFWKHGPTYVFVDGLAMSGTEAMTFVYPPNPAREGQVWGEAIDDFGTDLFFEAYRIMELVDAAWLYYSFPNPATGKKSSKASYVIEVDWDGERAVIGAGIYSRDWPGSCYEDEVSAKTLGASPNDESLREFVRCAARMLETDGYAAMEELESDARWTDGQHYVYVLDMMGNQLATGNRMRINGRPLHEWGKRGLRDKFDGRDMLGVGETFGESYVYYDVFNPMKAATEPKVGFLKRVVAQGVPLLVGSGYYHGSMAAASESGCEDDYVSAQAVHTPRDIEAFVQCAAEYVMEHGEEVARQAFNEDAPTASEFS